MTFDLRAHESRCQATYEALDAAWASCGEVDPHVLAPIINPAFAGGPVWPNLRQAYRTVRGPFGVLLASDGLSDPFDDSWADPPVQNGFAMEVYAVTGEEPDAKMMHALRFSMVAGFANLVAKNGHIHSLLEKMGTLTTELREVPIPDEHRSRFVNEHGRVCVLVGLDAPPVPRQVQGPVSSIRLANLCLLTLQELAYVLDHGEQGREEVSRRLLATGAPLVSSLTRSSVV